MYVGYVLYKPVPTIIPIRPPYACFTVIVNYDLDKTYFTPSFHSRIYQNNDSLVMSLYFYITGFKLAMDPKWYFGNGWWDWWTSVGAVPFVVCVNIMKAFKLLIEKYRDTKDVERVMEVVSHALLV